MSQFSSLGRAKSKVCRLRRTEEFPRAADAGDSALTARPKRRAFASGKPTVPDGPFTEAKEVIGGYWIVQARSKEEAGRWGPHRSTSNRQQHQGGPTF